jgi:hypothetical protein
MLHHAVGDAVLHCCCHRADPFVEVGLSEKGEHLLGAAGEVHLETVVKDLQERFARVPFQVGRGVWGPGHTGGRGACEHSCLSFLSFKPSVL